MKLCFSTLGCCDYSLEQSLALAKKFNINEIELRGIGGRIEFAEIPELSPENADKTLSMFEQYGVRPTVIGSSCRLHDATTHKDAKTAIEIAERLQAPFVRVFGNNLKPDRETATQNVIKALKTFCKTAEPSGVSVLLEVHGDFCNEATLSPIICEAGHLPNFGLIWDIAHSDRDYDDSWQVFYRFAAPYIRHVHIKDLRRADRTLTLPGNGDLPIRDIVEHMMQNGYNGAFSLEWEKKWHPELPPIEVALESFCEKLKQSTML